MLRALKLTVISVVLCSLGTLQLFADPLSAFTVTNTDSPDPVASGAQITYTIVVTNTGGAAQQGVVVTDQLNGVGGIGVPPQLQITSSRGSCTQTTTLVTCNGGNMEGRGVWTITVRGIVVAPSGTTINNTASVASNKQPQGTTTPATATTLVMGGTGGGPLPDLTISKNGPTSVVTTSPMTYTLTINNIGTANADNVKVVDTVPAGLTAISATGTSLFTCGVVGQTVTCTGGRVNFGSNATVTINATSPAATGTITNTASVDPDNTIAETNELNNTSALVNTAVTAANPTPNLSIELTDDSSVLAGAGPDPVTPGSLLTYKILVTNNSPYRADDVNIVDGTQGMVASSMVATFVVTNGTIGNFGGCSVNGSQAKCVASTLQAGGTILMTVSGQVIQGAGSTLLDTATVSGTIKNKGQNTTDSEITTVKPGIDLTITKVDSPDPVCAHSWPAAAPPATFLPSPVCLGGLTYVFVVGNSGIQTATGVLVRDPLPPNTIFDSFTAPGFAGGCGVDSNNVLTCTNGTINPESTSTITIVLVAPPGIGTVNNTVYVDPNNAIFEADEANNTANATTLVQTGIDLTVDKIQNFNPIATSGTETYTIRVDNVGPQDATGITVRDILPSGTIFRTASGDHGFTCSYSAASNAVTCNGASILGTESEFYGPTPAGEDHATITIVVFAMPIVGTMHNEVRVDPNNTIAEVSETNNIFTLDTTVINGGSVFSAFNELAVTKVQDLPPNPVARNAKVQYTITVTNDATDPANHVTVRDFLPAGATYIQATGTNQFLCTAANNVVNCTGGSLPAHAVGATAAKITVTMFAPDTPGTYTNQAVVDPDGTIPEGDETNNAASVQTVVQNAGNDPFYDLDTTQSQSPANNIARNGVLTYTILVHNLGQASLNDITVRDTLPAGSRYIESTGDKQFLCSNAGQVVTCTGGQLLSKPDFATITIKIFAPDTPGTYTNQAMVDPTNAIPEGDEINNSSSFQTIVTNGGNGTFNDLTIVKTATSNTTPGGEITYILTVSNLGSDQAANVAVRDNLPAGAVFVSADDTTAASLNAKFTCNQSGGVVNCTGATIGGLGSTTPPDSRQITIKVNAPNLIIPAFTNQAVVDPDNLIPEGDELNNTSSASTNVSSVINLHIDKDGPDTASQSDVKDYTIKVKNEAPDHDDSKGLTAFGVEMHDPLPVGLIVLAVDAGTGNNWACQVSQPNINVVDCKGDLNPEQEVEIKITVFITAEDNRSLDNEACVDPQNLIQEFNPPGESDNCSTATTPVGPAPKKRPDLEVTKTASPTIATPTQALNYTISVKNIGDADAQDPVTVTDTLDSKVTYSSASGSGWTCNFSAPTVTCTLAGLTAGSTAGDITINTTVNADSTGSITNTAVAAPATADTSDPANDNELMVDNNTSTVVTSIGPPGFDLILASIVDAPDPATRGQQVTYNVAVANTGTDPANGLVIRVTLPSGGVTFTSATGTNGFSCGAPSAGTLDCTGNMPGGGSTAIAVKFLVNLSAPDSLELSATVDPGNAFTEANESNNTDTETTSVGGAGCHTPFCIDLVAATLDGSPNPVQATHEVTFVFTIANIGATSTSASGGFHALFDLFGDVDTTQTITSSLGAITCSLNGSTVAGSNMLNDCTGDLGPGEIVTLTLTTTVNSGTTVTARGVADPDNVVPEESDFDPPSGPPFTSFGNNLLFKVVNVTP